MCVYKAQQAKDVSFFDTCRLTDCIYLSQRDKQYTTEYESNKKQRQTASEAQNAYQCWLPVKL